MATYLEFKNGDQTIFVEIEPNTADRVSMPEDGKAALMYRGEPREIEEGKASLSAGDILRSSLMKAERTLSEAFAAVRINAEAFMKQISAMDAQPTEIEVTFGLKASGELGNFAVGKLTGDANYTVKMVWKKQRPLRSAALARAATSDMVPYGYCDRMARLARVQTPGNELPAGTGFVVHADGLIATCAHVVSGSDNPPRGGGVEFNTGEQLPGRVNAGWWRSKRRQDVAIIQLDQPLPTTVLPLSAEPGAPSRERCVAALPFGDRLQGRPPLLRTFGFPESKAEEGLPGDCRVIEKTTENGTDSAFGNRNTRHCSYGYITVRT